MLNNDFQTLVQKYTRYRRKKRIRTIKRIAMVLSMVALGWFGYRYKEVLFPSRLFPKGEDQIAQRHPTVTPAVAMHDAEQAATEREAVDTPEEKPMPNDIYPRKARHLDEKSAQVLKFKITHKKNLFELIKREKKEHSYSSAIALANYFFEQKEYKEAIRWAIKASKKNPSDAMPWIIYAKCKAATGKKEIAKKALRIFLKHQHSQEVRRLLESL